MTLFSQKPYFVFFLLSFFFCLILCSSCEKTTTQPPPPAGPDTTSHEFVWEIMQFGRPSSSTLNDVAIIDENNIWAVGEIHTDETDRLDSLGNWVHPYNAVHWNGSEWMLFRFIKNSGLPILPVRGILYYADNDIWLAAGSIYHWNGNKALLSYQRDISTSEIITRLWASSDDNIYGVGSDGIIVHFNGNSWQKLNSGITDIINDIYGYQDNSNPNDRKILCAAGDAYDRPNGKLLSIEADQSVQEFSWVNPTVVNSVWLNNTGEIFACGVGVWQYRDNQWQEFPDLPGVLWERVRGNAANDVFVCGHVGYAAHYNGKSWKSYKLMNNALFTSLAVKDDLVVIVGARAEVIVGRRKDH